MVRNFAELFGNRELGSSCVGKAINYFRYGSKSLTIFFSLIFLLDQQNQSKNTLGLEGFLIQLLTTILIQQIIKMGMTIEGAKLKLKHLHKSNSMK